MRQSSGNSGINAAGDAWQRSMFSIPSLRSALKKLVRLLAPLAALATGTLGAHSAAGGVFFEVSQDERRFRTIGVISGAESAQAFYNYSEGSGHPDFGTQAGTETTCLYMDTTTNMLSLIMIGGTDPSDQGAHAAPQSLDLQVNHLTRHTNLALNDTPHAISNYTRGSTVITSESVDMDKTDGLIINGLNQGRTLNALISLVSQDGFKEWRVASGDPAHGGAFHDIELNKTLDIRELSERGAGGGNVGDGNGGDGINRGGDGGEGEGNTGSGNSLPEPTDLAIGGIGWLLCVVRPCRRRVQRK